MSKNSRSLVICIVMDILGYASFAMPGLGEISDVVFAPISALIFYKLFGGWKGAFGGIFNFVEEILPFSDFIPSFTIMWVWQHFTSANPQSATSKQGNIGITALNEKCADVLKK